MAKEAEKKKLSSNMEDYLETVALLSKKDKVTRVRDIGRLMKVKSPSVTAALETLSKNGLVIHEKYGYVKLTEEGRRLAEDVWSRHKALLRFLTEILKIDRQVAAEDACKIEHLISPQTFKRLTEFIRFKEQA